MKNNALLFVLGSVTVPTGFTTLLCKDKDAFERTLMTNLEAFKAATNVTHRVTEMSFMLDRDAFQFVTFDSAFYAGNDKVMTSYLTKYVSSVDGDAYEGVQVHNDDPQQVKMCFMGTPDQAYFHLELVYKYGELGNSRGGIGTRYISVNQYL